MTMLPELSNGGQREDNNYCNTRNFAPGWISAHKCPCMMAITTMWSESLCAFPKSCTSNESRSEHLNNGGWQEDKRTRYSTTKMSFSTKIICLGHCIIARDHNVVQNRCMPFLSSQTLVTLRGLPPFLWPYESKDSSHFFRLQCLSHWEVA